MHQGILQKNNLIWVLGAFEGINDFFPFIEENSIDPVIIEMRFQNWSAIKLSEN